MPVIEQDTNTTVNGRAIFTYEEAKQILVDAAVAAGLILPDMGETGDSVSLAFVKDGKPDVAFDTTYDLAVKTVDVEGAGTTPVTPPAE